MTTKLHSDLIVNQFFTALYSIKSEICIYLKQAGAHKLYICCLCAFCLWFVHRRWKLWKIQWRSTYTIFGASRVDVA